MKKLLPLAFFLVAIMTLFLIFPVAAQSVNVNTVISQGNTVFIGEQGLDVSSFCSPSCQIGWWAPGASIASSSPDQQYSISSPSTFFVSPATFGSYPGSWYLLPSKTQAFIVADPQLALRVQDTSVSVDVTNGWVYRGDTIGFQIDSNLYAISQRTGGGYALVTIYVQPPTGGTYAALYDSSGKLNRIDDIQIQSNPTYTLGIWDTSNSLYPAGKYTIWAECDVNHIYDNYGISGKTITPQISLLDQEQNPLIRAGVPTTNTLVPTTTVRAATTITVTVTTTVPVTAESTPPPVMTTSAPLQTTSAALATVTTAGPITTRSPGFDLIMAALALAADFAILQVRR
jgi:hypothetical protein